MRRERIRFQGAMGGHLATLLDLGFLEWPVHTTGPDEPGRSSALLSGNLRDLATWVST